MAGIDLTKRQRDVCELVAEGLRSKQIARKPGIGAPCNRTAWRLIAG